jgi:glutamate-1-semialdehyde 2,1-aminomutase
MIHTSQQLFVKAQKYIPGGVNSPVRAFGAVGGTPRFISKAKGCYLWDADGNRYIDYVGSWGPMILGHSHPEVISAIQQAAALGTSYGAPTRLEIELAEKICRMVPSIEKVRLVNSGTEATMSALRLARAFTDRPMVVKFDGCYHGHADSFLVQAGSGVATLGLPNTPGVPREFTELTLSLPFNDLAAVEKAFQEYPGKISAVICEPVTGNMGVIIPSRNYLAGLIELAHQNGALVIFDEVMTGFRIAPGGVQEMYNLRPDLTTLGKIVGGGLPIGAFGGRREIMKMIAPEGAVYQAGTLSGNPIAVTAGLKTLSLLEESALYEELDQRTSDLCSQLIDTVEKKGIPARINRCGSMFTLFFTGEEIRNFDSVKRCDTKLFGKFFSAMLDQGIYLAPSQFEACFVSTAHGEDVIEQTAVAAGKALSKI